MKNEQGMHHFLTVHSGSGSGYMQWWICCYYRYYEIQSLEITWTAIDYKLKSKGGSHKITDKIKQKHEI